MFGFRPIRVSDNPHPLLPAPVGWGDAERRADAHRREQEYSLAQYDQLTGGLSAPEAPRVRTTWESWIGDDNQIRCKRRRDLTEDDMKVIAKRKKPDTYNPLAFVLLGYVAPRRKPDDPEPNRGWLEKVEPPEVDEPSIMTDADWEDWREHHKDHFVNPLFANSRRFYFGDIGSVVQIGNRWGYVEKLSESLLVAGAYSREYALVRCFNGVELGTANVSTGDVTFFNAASLYVQQPPEEESKYSCPGGWQPLVWGAKFVNPTWDKTQPPSWKIFRWLAPRGRSKDEREGYSFRYVKKYEEPDDFCVVPSKPDMRFAVGAQADEAHERAEQFVPDSDAFLLFQLATDTAFDDDENAGYSVGRILAPARQKHYALEHYPPHWFHRLGEMLKTKTATQQRVAKIVEDILHRFFILKESDPQIAGALDVKTTYVSSARAAQTARGDEYFNERRVTHSSHEWADIFVTRFGENLLWKRTVSEGKEPPPCNCRRCCENSRRLAVQTRANRDELRKVLRRVRLMSYAHRRQVWFPAADRELVTV